MKYFNNIFKKLFGKIEPPKLLKTVSGRIVLCFACNQELLQEEALLIRDGRNYCEKHYYQIYQL